MTLAEIGSNVVAKSGHVPTRFAHAINSEPAHELASGVWATESLGSVLLNPPLANALLPIEIEHRAFDVCAAMESARISLTLRARGVMNA